MMRPTLGDVRYTYSYEGTLDPDTCRAMMAREDPKVHERLKRFWTEANGDCARSRQREHLESQELSIAACQRKFADAIKNQDNLHTAHAFFDRLVVPSIVCGLAVPVDSSKLVAPWCFFLEVPDQHRPLWQKMMQLAYVGEARDSRKIIPACKEDELKRPSTPFLKFVEAFLKDASDQVSASNKLEQIGFGCAPSRQNPVEQTCKPNVIGFKWYESPSDFDNPDPEFLVFIGADFAGDGGRLCALAPR